MERQLIDGTKYEVLRVKSITAPSWRWKRKDLAVKTRIATSLVKFGQIKNIVVRQLHDDTYEVIDGAEVLEALKGMNEERVLCYNLGKISDDDAKLIAMALDLNRIECNMIDLSKAIKNITHSDITLSAISPFSNEDIADIRRLLEFDWSVFTKNEDPTPLMF